MRSRVAARICRSFPFLLPWRRPSSWPARQVSSLTIPTGSSATALLSRPHLLWQLRARLRLWCCLPSDVNLHVLKKRVHSRAYHSTLQSALKAGVPIEQARVRAREAGTLASRQCTSVAPTRTSFNIFKQFSPTKNGLQQSNYLLLRVSIVWSCCMRTTGTVTRFNPTAHLLILACGWMGEWSNHDLAQSCFVNLNST